MAEKGTCILAWEGQGTPPIGLLPQETHGMGEIKSVILAGADTGQVKGVEEELPSPPQRRSQKPEAIPLPKPPSLQQQTSGTNIYSQFLLLVPQVLCGGPSGVTCAVMTMFCMGGVLPNLLHPAGGLGSMYITPSWVRSAVFFPFMLPSQEP